MDRDAFILRVLELRSSGADVDSIAETLSVTRQVVEQALGQPIDPGSSGLAVIDGREVPFVGRDAELGVGRGLVDALLRGHGGVLLLTGEPGAGKTRLASRLADTAVARGASAVRAAGRRDDTLPPYALWDALIRGLLEDGAGAQLPDLGPGAALLAEISPVLADRFPSRPSVVPLDPERAKLQLFDALSRLLRELCGGPRVVLLIDDLHWADDASLEFLETFAQEPAGLPCLLIGTARSADATAAPRLGRTLAALATSEGFSELTVGGLERGDLARLIAASLAASPPDRLVDAIATQTAGNPLYTLQLLRELRRLHPAADWTVADPPALPLPRGVERMVAQRTEALSARCRTLLRGLAVMGGTFDRARAGIVLEGADEEELLTLIEEAAGHGFIQPEGDGGGYAFSHAIVQDALLASLSAARRAALHGRIGEGLEALYGATAEAHAAELAHHFGRAERATYHRPAVRYARLAGERSLSAFAHAEAAEHLRRALELKADQPMDGESAAISLSLARARKSVAAMSEMAEPWELMVRALEFYVEANDLPAALAAAELPFYLVLVPRQAARVVPLIERMLPLVTGGSIEEARLLAVQGLLVAMVLADYGRARAALDRALAISRAAGDEPLMVRVLATTVSASAFHWRAALEECLEGIALTERLGPAFVDVRLYSFGTVFAHSLGDHQLARRLLATANAITDETGEQIFHWQNRQFETAAALSDGDWAGVRRIWAEQGGDGQPYLLMHGTRALAEYLTGEFAEGDRLIARFVAGLAAVPPGPQIEHTWAAAVLAYADYLTGSDARHEAAARSARAVMDVLPPHVSFALFAQCGLAISAVARGDVAAARSWYDALREPLTAFPERHFVIPLSMSSQRLLGLLARAAGRDARAIAHLRQACAVALEHGMLPDLAWSYHDLADALAHRASPGDRGELGASIEESRRLAEQLGMRPLLERLSAFAEPRGASPAPAAARLTKRELEVLALVADGLSNREIASMLVVSHHTVARHVANILRKLDASSRARAVATAMEQGLLPRSGRRAPD